MAWGRCFDVLHRFDEVHRVVVVLVDAGRHREDVGVEDDVFRREADAVHQNAVGALADLELAGPGIGLAHLVERHDDDGGAVAAQQFRLLDEFVLPSFMEMELTTGLPCTHLRPASSTSHLEESIITGTRAMSGSPAMRFRKRTMAASASSIPSSMLMSMIWAPFSTCCLATSRASS
jgi:hypothetical protein